MSPVGQGISEDLRRPVENLEKRLESTVYVICGTVAMSGGVSDVC
jgi:ClpP class serine protease